MNKEQFTHTLLHAKYSTKYEPIFNKDTLDIYAYEALSKFDINEEIISTEEIFRRLHSSNDFFFHLEKRNKEKQIKDFTFDPNKKLFVNFDADIVVTKEQQEYWSNFLEKNKKDLVVEITENGSDDEKSASVMRDFASWLHEHEINIALDDFAQEGSMFSFIIMNKSQYIKIDKSFLRMIEQNKHYENYLEGLLKTIRLNKQFSIIEGVETQEDFNLVKRLPCDYIQGYFFKNQVIIK